MPYSSEIYEKANREINRRRVSAEGLAKERHDALAQACPELLEYEREMSQAGVAVFKAMSIGEENVQKYIEGLRVKSETAKNKKLKLLEDAGLPKDYLEIPYTCKLCNDTGHSGGRRCSCYKLLLRQYAFKELAKNAPIESSTFDNFDVTYYPDTKDPKTGISPRKRMSEIYEFCKSYADDFDRYSCSLFMHGATGLGKTHLSLAIAGKAIENGFDVVYGPTQNILLKLERERFNRGNYSSATAEDMVLDCDLLILDDLGAEFSTQFSVSVIYNIINSRTLSGLPTIISTNLSLEELEERYTQRVTSRIIGSFTSLWFCGKDVRQLKRK